MGKRLFLVVVMAAGLACKSSGNGDSMMPGSSAATSGMGQDAIERALRDLGIDGRVMRIDLNEGRKSGRVRIASVHLLSELLLIESADAEPRVFALERKGLKPRWVSPMSEPTRFPATENDELVILVSQHYAQVFESATGNRALQFTGGALAGVRRPFLELPASPTGAAGVGADTFYIPSLGGTSNNKTLEAFSAVNGQRGWGYRTSGDILTTPIVGGSSGDPKLYFVTTSGLITCVDAANYGYRPRGPRWEELLEARCDFGICVTSDTRDRPGAVFAVDREGVVYSVNRITGDRNWIEATGREPTGAPKVFQNRLLVVPMRSGLTGFDAANVLFALRGESGPDAGTTHWVRAGSPVTVGGINFQIQGEVLSASAASEEGMFSVDGGRGTNRASLYNDAVVKVGRSTYLVEDRGSAPLWSDLAYDRIVGMIGNKLVAMKGTSMTLIDLWTGMPAGETVELSGARLVPGNATDANLFVIGGDAIVYALFPR